MINLPEYKNGEELDLLKKLRRNFHRYPELGFCEFWTTSLICETLSSLGFEIIIGKDLYDHKAHDVIRKVTNDAVMDEAYKAACQRLPLSPWLEKMRGGFTGVIAHKRGGSGPRIGFRFDIDGLPIKESSENSHLPRHMGFASENSNMHACGHDGHTTIGLGLAKRISNNISSLNGDYYLIFQPAEELAQGGYLLSKNKIIRSFDYFIPTHLGVVNRRQVVCGMTCLALKRIKATFSGKNAHAGVCPEEGNNALLAGAAAIVGIYGISRHSKGISRVNIGLLQSENPPNIISDHTSFEVDIRGQSDEVCTYISDQVSAIISGAAIMNNVTAVIENVTEAIAASNSDEMIGMIRTSAKSAGLRGDSIVDNFLTSGSEDATYLMREVAKNGGKTSFLCLGSPTYGGHHTPTFDFDEDMMGWGVEILWEFIKMIQEHPDSGDCKILSKVDSGEEDMWGII